MKSDNPASSTLPAVFRIGDIGVASEWRDISYDWSPVLTPDGVFIYSYLRDTYDHQRNVRPFLLTPEGPTKKSIQFKLGLKSAYAMQGPEYLLCTVGLLHVEMGYGASVDPERPNHTHVAYYVVGRLDHPALDWWMLDRVLDALMIGLDVPSQDREVAARQRKATAALRSLGQAGLFQYCDPGDLFYPFGAWPNLLSTLIQDQRWTTLFSSLHGADAAMSYRQQARSWIEYTQRSTARLTDENRMITEQILSAQRRRPHGAGSDEDPAPPRSAARCDRAGSQDTVTSAREPVEVTSTGFVTAVSLRCHQAIEVTSTGLMTSPVGSHPEGINAAATRDDDMSLAVDQLMLSSRDEIMTPTYDPMAPDDISATSLDHVPAVAPHLRDAELTSTRFDASFWCAVNSILHQSDVRYDASAGEKQAVFRRFKRQDLPVGVVLGALRATMTLPEQHRPKRFGDALKRDVFHLCVQQALSLLPTRTASPTGSSSWAQFLQAYRAIGHPSRLRDVSISDYHVLHALFSKQPDACWDVLNRVEHAGQLPELSPAYLRRALVNNQRVAMQEALRGSSTRVQCDGSVAESLDATRVSGQRRSVDDPRFDLLSREAVAVTILRDDMTEDFIRQWIEEADKRRDSVYNRPGWLRWGIESGYAPAQHPLLHVRSQNLGTVPVRVQLLPDAYLSSPESPSGIEFGLALYWDAALSTLAARLPHDDFATWIKPCSLIALEPGGTEGEPVRAVIAAPNIFVREELEGRFLVALKETMQAVLDHPVCILVVIQQS